MGELQSPDVKRVAVAVQVTVARYVKSHLTVNQFVVGSITLCPPLVLNADAVEELVTKFLSTYFQCCIWAV